MVAAAVAHQVPQHAGAEHERRQHAATARPGVERHPRADGTDVDARDSGVLASLPLPQRQVDDLVPVGGEPLGQVAIPPLGTADGVWEQAVIDDADPHVRWPEALRFCGTIAKPSRVGDQAAL